MRRSPDGTELVRISRSLFCKSSWRLSRAFTASWRDSTLLLSFSFLCHLTRNRMMRHITCWYFPNCFSTTISSFKWNFPWQTSVSTCECFLTFRRLTLSSSSGCAGCLVGPEMVLVLPSGCAGCFVEPEMVLVVPLRVCWLLGRTRNGSGSTKHPAHPEEGEGFCRETSEKLYILTQLSALENFIEFCCCESCNTYNFLSCISVFQIFCKTIPGFEI